MKKFKAADKASTREAKKGLLLPIFLRLAAMKQ